MSQVCFVVQHLLESMINKMTLKEGGGYWKDCAKSNYYHI